MKLDLINKYIVLLKKELSYGFTPDQKLRWECQSNFVQHWDLDRLDVKSMLDACLKHPQSGRLWGGEKESIKEFLLKITDRDKEFVRVMFRDLLHPEKDILLRVDRFINYCEQMAALISPPGITLDHKHDYRSVSLYLAFALPNEYCLFNYRSFAIAAESIGLRDVPPEFGITRFFKISKSLHKVMSRDEGLMKIYDELTKDLVQDASSLMMVYDFYHLISRA